MCCLDVPPPEDHVSRSVVGSRSGAECMVIAKTTGKPWPIVEGVDVGGRRGFRELTRPAVLLSPKSDAHGEKIDALIAADECVTR